jgi:hypothetical protein
MKNSKKNNSILLAYIALICGCQSTQSFKMTSFEKEELNVVEIDRNRIIQECYFMNAEKENNWRHQYVLYMLNKKNEAIPVFYPTNQGKQECMTHLKKVEKILKNQSHVKLCVRDRLEKMVNNKTDPEFHDFGALGKYESPYYALTFDTICNSKECYSISDTWTTTCPSFNK